MAFSRLKDAARNIDCAMALRWLVGPRQANGPVNNDRLTRLQGAFSANGGAPHLDQ
jgi:hypothetical protein